MTPIALTPWDLGLASVLIFFAAGLSLALSLDFARSLLIAAARMVVGLFVQGPR